MSKYPEILKELAFVKMNKLTRTELDKVMDLMESAYEYGFLDGQLKVYEHITTKQEANE